MHFHFRERMWCRIPLPASPLLLRSTPLHVPMAPLGLIFLSMKSLKKKTIYHSLHNGGFSLVVFSVPLMTASLTQMSNVVFLDFHAGLRLLHMAGIVSSI